MNEYFVINIGRQLGSGGREIGKKLAEKFGIGYYDKELIDLASKESGFCKEFFEKADENASHNFLGGFYSMRFPYAGSSSAVTGNNCLSNDSLFKIQSDVIREQASKESCVFVGRCADYILRSHPRCMNVFITADQADRVARLSQIHQISADEAEKWMEKSDKKRADYYNYYSFKTWGMASSYHLCINSSMLGIEGTMEFIAELAKRKLSI
ncbi:MAG: cytidylate kinase-like family protein [Bacteroidaceae bacterium]|nr:cytidylate kinase-like family protein [Bacteroidaceae bacterium]